MRHRVALLALALAGISLLLASCSGDSDDGSGGGASEDLSEVDADDLLTRSADRMEQLESFHFVVEHENGATAIVSGIEMERAEGDVQGQDRMQLQVEASFAGANIETGIVILPEESYLQNPLTGRWQEEDDLDIESLFDPSSGIPGLMREVSGAEVVDQEAAGGVDSYVVEATVDSGSLTSFVRDAEPGTQVTARVWIGVDDLLVRRIEVRGPIGPDDNDDVVRIITLSAFDEPVDIGAPT